jgi:cation diffusion facilitator CzcD-associated flavoprotein CzcO
MSLSTAETHADVLVAGAGAAGLSTAIALLKKPRPKCLVPLVLV